MYSTVSSDETAGAAEAVERVAGVITPDLQGLIDNYYNKGGRADVFGERALLGLWVRTSPTGAVRPENSPGSLIEAFDFSGADEYQLGGSGW